MPPENVLTRPNEMIRGRTWLVLGRGELKQLQQAPLLALDIFIRKSQNPSNNVEHICRRKSIPEVVVLSANAKTIPDHFSILLQILSAQIDLSVCGRIHTGKHGDRRGLSTSILDEIRSTKKPVPARWRSDAEWFPCAARSPRYNWGRSWLCTRKWYCCAHDCLFRPFRCRILARPHHALYHLKNPAGKGLGLVDRLPEVHLGVEAARHVESISIRRVPEIEE